MGFFLVFTNSCKKDDSSNNPTSGETGTVTDIEGNVYKTIKIGTQIWMVENLKTSKYRNGDLITIVTDEIEWRTISTEACCTYNNNVALGNKYGKLYNWYAVNDSRIIAPLGWHIPTVTEWSTLEKYITANLGTSGSVAKALASKTDWASASEKNAIGNDLSINNSSGFTALPGGLRSNDGKFRNIGVSSFWWHSTEYNASSGWSLWLGNDASNMDNSDAPKEDGFYIRCVKD